LHVNDEHGGFCGDIPHEDDYLETIPGEVYPAEELWADSN
jgi:hypothetical protein